MWDQLDALTAPEQVPEDPPLPPEPASAPAPPPRPRPAAGASAQREYERRVAELERERTAVRERRPWIGRLVARTMREPQSTAAWAKGASGERHLAGHLDSLTTRGARALHDRALPRRRANIDHIVVAPSGVWVIDAKTYKGRVEKRDLGGWFSSDVRLYVAGRNRTKLVDAMAWQVRAVRDVVGPDVPIRPALCFIGSDFPIYSMSFRMNGVMVSCVRSLKKAIVRRGPLSAHEVDRLEALIDDALPPAV